MHPRLSVLSTSSLPTGVAGDRSSLSTPPPVPPATRLSLPASNSSTLTLGPRSSIATSVGGGPVPNIYDRNLNKTRTTEVSAAAFAFLFSEMIQYTQKRVSGIGDLERRCVLCTMYFPSHIHSKLTLRMIIFLGCSLFVVRCSSFGGWGGGDGRLNTLGYRIGQRVLELLTWRNESGSRAPKREIRFLLALRSIHAPVWRAVFGKQADAIEKSVENDDECTSGLPGAVSVHCTYPPIMGMRLLMTPNFMLLNLFKT